ncbi:MAG: hypothetical protein AAF721_12760 [Myxococcota bacterium]
MTLSYRGALAELQPPSGGLALNNVVHGIGFLRGESAVVATGRRASQSTVSARFDLDAGAAWTSFDTYLEPPWDTRHNIEPLRLPGGASGFAAGGEDGVLIGRLDVGDDLQQVGLTVAAGAERTFTRVAFNDQVLLVASGGGLRTFDITTEPADGDWVQLSEIVIGAPATFESGAVIPCPI